MAPDIHDMFSRLEVRVSALEVTSAVEAERHKSLIKRLDKLDSHLLWLVRLVIGGLIAAIVAFVTGGGLA